MPAWQAKAGTELPAAMRYALRGGYSTQQLTPGQAELPHKSGELQTIPHWLFSSNPSGELFCGRVHHKPYQIAPAVCTRWSTEPLRLDGFSEATEAPPSMLVAAPVDVKIFPLRGCEARR